MMKIPKKLYNPCDDCKYGKSKQNQESSICNVCEFKMYLNTGLTPIIRKTYKVFEDETVDVAPIVHGEWLSFDEEANEWYCSKCGNIWQLNDGTPQENCMNFCTKCGAKMDEKEKKDEV